MRRTLKLTLAYDGTAFHGWQRQPALRTVQGEVEQTAMRVLRSPISLLGASRTDAGVHALGQVAHIRTDSPIPVDRLHRAVGERLPDDIGLVDLIEAPPGFHAIRHASGKLYRYTIYNDDGRPVLAELLGRAWHVRFPLDIERMRAAAALLVGRRDFRSFAGLGAPREDCVRTIRRVCVSRMGPAIRIDVEGDGFLYNMVRIIAGTLVDIGRGHWSPDRIPEILAALDRRAAGQTAPPQGLTLRWVSYPPFDSPIYHVAADAAGTDEPDAPRGDTAIDTHAEVADE